MSAKNSYLGNHKAQKTVESLLKGEIQDDEELYNAINSVGRFSSVPHVRSALAKIIGIERSNDNNENDIHQRELFFDICSGSELMPATEEVLNDMLVGATKTKALAIGYLMIKPAIGEIVAPMDIMLSDGTIKILFLRPDYDDKVKI